MSRAHFSPFDVPCPTCHVGKYRPCELTDGRQSSGYHSARVAAAGNDELATEVAKDEEQS